MSASRMSRVCAELPRANRAMAGFPWVPSGPDCGVVASLDPERIPKISVVTPSLNQGQFIEETIRSVLLQNYPRFEYTVMDGGSSDGTVSVIQRYAPWLTYWESKPDRGQSHAINEGLSRATGDILTYINSDDVYLPGAFSAVAATFLEHPETDFVYGMSVPVDVHGESVGYLLPARRYSRWRLLYLHNYLSQPATFWRREAWIDLGGFDESLHLVMDYDYWIRAAKANKAFKLLPQTLVRFRYHAAAKTVSAGRTSSQRRELCQVFAKNGLPCFTHTIYNTLLAPVSHQCAKVRYALAGRA